MTVRYKIEDGVEAPNECPNCSSRNIDGPYTREGEMTCWDCGHSFECYAMEFVMSQREIERHNQIMEMFGNNEDES